MTNSIHQRSQSSPFLTVVNIIIIIIMWSMGFGYYDEYYEGGRVNRSGWSDKSAAASRREAQAKQLLDTFLEQCAKLPPSSFPKTEENLVTADIHLTNPCWSSFRKYALSKGCQVKRREASLTERRVTHDKRKGKMYVVSATLPVHPSQAVQAQKEKEEQAAVAAAKRKEREQKRAEEKKRQEQVKRRKIEDAYQKVVANVLSTENSASAAIARQ